MYDSHCHLDFPAFAGDLEGHLERARKLGIQGWHVPGCGPSQWDGLARLVGVPGVCLGVGIHPGWALEVVPDGNEAAPEALASLVEEAMGGIRERAETLGAVAIGECGLDRPLMRSRGASRTTQLALFEAQLVLARDLMLPVVLHVVGEHGATLDVLRRVGALPAGGVVHGYSGSADLVERYVAHGLSIGLGTRLTAPGARRAREALQRVPLDHLLLETDAPDQAAAGEGGPGRRGCGVPSDLAVVVGAAAAQRGLPREKLAERTAENARRLFG